MDDLPDGFDERRHGAGELGFWFALGVGSDLLLDCIGERAK